MATFRANARWIHLQVVRGEQMTITADIGYGYGLRRRPAAGSLPAQRWNIHSGHSAPMNGPHVSEGSYPGAAPLGPHTSNFAPTAAMILS